MAQCRNSPIGKWVGPIGKCLAAVAACFAAALTVFGQTQAPRPQFREGVDVGHVDVTVLDGKRQAIRGLTAADFTLRVAAKVQPIRTFAAVDIPGPLPLMALASWTREIAPDVQTNTNSDEGRLVVIFWDRSIPPGPKMEVAKRIARAAVNELGPNDLAAITAVRSRPVQNFTADRARLLKAIDEAYPGSAPGEDEALLFGARNDPHETCFCNACVLEQIRDVATALRDVPRPKLLLFIGSQLTMDVRDAAPMNTLVGSHIDAECAYPLKTARTSMLQALDVANVTVHTIDPSGLETGPGLSASSNLRPGNPVIAQTYANAALSVAYHGQIRVLPDRTGGRVVTNTNAPDTFVPAVFAESASYYVLGFDLPPGLQDRDKVEVTVNRRGAKVHVQRAYERPAPPATLAPAGDTDGQPRVTGQNSSPIEGVVLTPAGIATWAVEAVLPARGLPMSASALPFAARDSDRATVVVVSGVQALTPNAKGAPVRLDFLVGALDPRARSKAETRHAVEIGSDAPRLYDVVSRLELKAGSYEIRSGAAAGDGRAGSVVTYVDVPDFRKEALSLSGLALTTVPPGAGTAVDGADDALPFVPTARRTFAATETLRSFVKVYQGGSDPIAPVQFEVRIYDTRGQVMLNAGGPLDPGRWNADRSAPIGLDMPLAGLAAGDYLLSVAATAAKRTVRRDVRFAIVPF